MHFLLKKKGEKKEKKEKTLPQTEPQKLPPALRPPLSSPPTSFLGLRTKAIGGMVHQSLPPPCQLQAQCVGANEGTSTTRVPQACAWQGAGVYRTG